MRKFIFVLLFIIASLSYLFEVDELLVKKFSFFNDLKVSYINKVISISSSIEKHFEKELISEIIIGPKNHTTIENMELFLKSVGFENVSVIKSEISYR